MKITGYGQSQKGQEQKEKAIRGHFEEVLNFIDWDEKKAWVFRDILI